MTRADGPREISGRPQECGAGPNSEGAATAAGGSSLGGTERRAVTALGTAFAETASGAQADGSDPRAAVTDIARPGDSGAAGATARSQVSGEAIRGCVEAPTHAEPDRAQCAWTEQERSAGREPEPGSGVAESPAHRPKAAPNIAAAGIAAPLSLIGLVWLLGLSALAWPAAAWLALLVYALGSPSLAVRQWRRSGATSLRLAGGRWPHALLLGGLLGAALAALALVGFAVAPPPAEGEGFLRLLPPPAMLTALTLLVLAEELLWRGMLPTALTRAGRPDWQVVLLTTLGYAANHLAAAPLPLPLRWGLVAMALPIGLANGWLSQATGSLWGGVIAHAMPMLLMVARAT